MFVLALAAQFLLMNLVFITAYLCLFMPLTGELHDDLMSYLEAKSTVYKHSHFTTKWNCTAMENG